MPKLAVIDMGTNTFHLLIAEVTSKDGLVPLTSAKQMTRLGEGFSVEKRIRKAAGERSIAALLHFRSVLARFAVDDLSVTGTSAVREAVNRDAFLAEVQRCTGFEVRVLSGEEEAQCSFTGIRSVMGDRASWPMVTVDIGGGSTELVLAQEDKVVWLASLSLGVVRLSESYLREDPLAAASLAQLTHEIEGFIDPMIPHLPRGCCFAGTAGTVTTLAALEQKMASYTVSHINRYPLSYASVARMTKHLSSLSRHERCELVGLESGREDILIAGSLILRCLMERFKYDPVYVSDSGVREGILLRRFFELYPQMAEV